MILSAAFRPATRDDLSAIVALLAADQLGAIREDASEPLAECYVRAYAAMQDDPNQLLAVADAAGEIIGTLQLTFIPGLSRSGSWRGQIEAVRIAADHRGPGLGNAFFEWAIAQCRERGCSLVQLTTDRSRADAHRFYDRLGFEASHMGYKLRL